MTQRGQCLVAAGPHHVPGHVAGLGPLSTATPGAVPGLGRAVALRAMPCALQALPSCATCLIPYSAGATLLCRAVPHPTPCPVPRHSASPAPHRAVPHVPLCCHPVSRHTMCPIVPCHFPCCHVVLPSHAVCHTVLSSHPNLSHPVSHTALSSRAMCHPMLSSHPMPCPTLCRHPMSCHVPRRAAIPCHTPRHVPHRPPCSAVSLQPCLRGHFVPPASCGPIFLSGYC